jgi:hypothetical protein
MPDRISNTPYLQIIIIKGPGNGVKYKNELC